MRRVRAVILAILLGTSAWPAFGQGTLEYKFGDGQGSAPGPSASERTIREGWGAVWGKGGNGGTAAGQIGTTLPPAEYSRRRSEIEAARAASIQEYIRQIRQAQPALDPKEHLRRYVQERDAQGLQKYGITRNPDDLYFPWRTQQPEVKSQLGEVYYTLRTAQPKDEQEAELARLGLEGVRLADESAATDDAEDAAFYFSVAQVAADILVGIDPVTGTLRSVYEATTGINLVTREALSPFERGLAVFGVVTLSYGQKFEKGLAAVGNVARKSRVGEATWEAALAYAKHFGEGFGKFRAIGASAEDALTRYASILREAADGPRLRMEALAAQTNDLITPAMRQNPDHYKTGIKFSYLMPPRNEPFFARAAEADALGQAWVGPNYRKSSTETLEAYISHDERYVYRRPVYKPREQAWQANLERRDPESTRILSNFHINIFDL